MHNPKEVVIEFIDSTKEKKKTKLEDEHSKVNYCQKW